MMPISALPPLPMPLPILSAAPVMLDFTALLQGGPVAAPVAVSTEEEAQPVQTILPDLEAPEPQTMQPLPAAPPILAMLQPPVPVVQAMPEPAPEPIAVAAAMPMVQSPAPLSAPAKVMVPVKPTRADVADKPVARPLSHEARPDHTTLPPEVDPSINSALPARESVTPAIVRQSQPARPAPATEPAPMRAQVMLPIQPDAPRAFVLPVLSAPAPIATPTPPVSPTMLEESSLPPLIKPVIAVETAMPDLPMSPDKPAPPLPPSAIIAAPAPSVAVEAPQPQPLQRAQPAPVPAMEPALVPVLAPVALPIQPDAPRPARATPALPPLSASAPTAAPAPPASPTMREVPPSPPPVEVQALVADAATLQSPAAPDQPAAPLPQLQPVATAPVQRTDAPQPPIDTTDPRWIERMAQEIAEIADGDGRTRFRLNPETLGSMEVSVRHTPDGISVRFEVESEATRTLLAHAEHRLQAEARAHGLRIADAQVDLADRGQRDGRERPAEQPLIAIRTGPTADSTPSAERIPASARYA